MKSLRTLKVKAFTLIENSVTKFIKFSSGSLSCQK